MNTLSQLLFIVFLIFISKSFAQEQQEILIVGDMHQLPGIVKRAYRPTVKKILKYKPELIMAEYSKTGDTAAMGEWNSKFKEAYLKKKASYTYNNEKIKQLQTTPNKNLDSIAFRQLQAYYLSIGDQGNHRMYGYFARHGVTKKFKPYGNQNPDLTFQLMRQLELKSVYGVDSHAGYQGYWPAWQRALKSGTKEGKKAFKKAMRKDSWGNIFAGLSWSLGRYMNKPKTLESYYRINSLRYKGFSGEDYDLQIKKWDDRNVNMAKNILDVLANNDVKRSVLIVGAGHAKAVSEELKRLSPNLKVIMYNDLKNHIK
ncbi:hypothetical protein J4050_11585 [Winogradskyella sp. DF17]|uniref:Haem-binding uptake Tiki superfamily ChaN domain-containing protein n=1 Tax=Winogradskyella pelagia TaxID=2819984 RepID=A0ABS3T4N4_9FLAO|nr:DUF5694 domain-containing protein [Winogradskyella sp. DF17]MBO3117394.1 hypothetical protein [Winogradskyella sp. DF17]